LYKCYPSVLKCGFCTPSHWRTNASKTKSSTPKRGNASLVSTLCLKSLRALPRPQHLVRKQIALSPVKTLILRLSTVPHLVCSSIIASHAGDTTQQKSFSHSCKLFVQALRPRLQVMPKVYAACGLLGLELQVGEDAPTCEQLDNYIFNPRMPACHGSSAPSPETASFSVFYVLLTVRMPITPLSLFGVYTHTDKSIPCHKQSIRP